MTFKSLSALLPNGSAFCLPFNSTIKKLIEAISDTINQARLYIELNFLDQYPEYSRDLSDYEELFALAPTMLNNAGRVSRIKAAFRSTGGQSPFYIQTVLQEAGFDLYVHDPWTSETIPPGESGPILIDPLTILRPLYIDENPPSGFGYPLANRIYTTEREDVVYMGAPVAFCGNSAAYMGNVSDEDKDSFINYAINSAFKGFVFYVGNQNLLSGPAQILASRREELEVLILKLKPAHLWCGLYVEYVN